MQTETVAVIDLGSNTARLIVLRTVLGHSYQLIDEIREVVRLRQGMTAQGLSSEAVARALFTLRLFKQYCDSTKIDKIIASATSAVRDAPNGRFFVQRVQQEIGLDLQILTGEQEAYYGVLGVLNDSGIREGLVLDIGGGSAQLSWVQDGQYQAGYSAPIGALALHEQFVQNDPITTEEYDALKQEIATQLDAMPIWEHSAKALVGMGGTIRNFAKIDAKRTHYPLHNLRGYQLTLESIKQTNQLLRERTLKERRKIKGLNRDRADIILAGGLVVEEVLSRCGLDSLFISQHGLREGLFFKEFWSHLAYPAMSDVQRFGVLNLARVYAYQKNHATHVRYLAGRLFEQLTPLHGYGTDALLLLESAALLHDIGTIIGYNNHHKHSQTLIINNGLPGFTPRETALISLLTRYHRKGKPTLDEFEAIVAKDDKTLLVQLTAILRLAEFLERGRNGTVDDITAVWTQDTLHLTLIADTYPAVELWEAERNAADLVAYAFKREVHIESTASPDEWQAFTAS